MPIALLLIILVSIFYVPQLNTQYEESQRVLNEKNQELQKVTARHDKLQQDLDAFNKKSPTEKQLVMDQIPTDTYFREKSLVEQLQAMKDGAQVDIASLNIIDPTSPLPSTANDLQIKAKEITMSVVGSTPSNIVTFLQLIEKNPRIFHIRSVRQDFSEGKAKADITASLYWGTLTNIKL